MGIKALILFLAMSTFPLNENMSDQNLVIATEIETNFILKNITGVDLNFWDTYVEEYTGISTISVTQGSSFVGNEIIYFFFKLPENAQIILFNKNELEILTGKKFYIDFLSSRNCSFKNVELNDAFLDRETEEYTFLVESNTAFLELHPIPVVMFVEDGELFFILPGIQM